ncbi:MAG: glycerol-3-phosphate dehydrogenase C-terminal domain-containing protein, partial [Pseudomonadota bacterium]
MALLAGRQLDDAVRIDVGKGYLGRLVADRHVVQPAAAALDQPPRLAPAVAQADAPENVEHGDPGLDLCAAEVRAHLRWGAVLHLEDLLLRRVRLGMWDPETAASLLPTLRPVLRRELGWSFKDWQRERDKMLATCGQCHSANFAKGELEKGDDMIRQADRLMAEAIRIVADLYENGLLEKP